MNTPPDFLHPVSRETIRRRLEELPLIGLDDFLTRAISFLRLSRVLATSGRTRFQLPKSLRLLPCILAHGRSGTGKTTFGYFLYLSLSQTIGQDVTYYDVRLGSLLNPNLGQTSRNIEELFDFVSAAQELKEVPFIHFDEIDAITLSRARPNEHDAIRRSLSSLLAGLDRMVLIPSTRWVLYATTNILNLVDPALIRRFRLKLDFEAKPWGPKHYSELISRLTFSNSENPSAAGLLPIAQACCRKRLTPNDVCQAVVDAMIACSQEPGNGYFHKTLSKLVASRQRTISVNRKRNKGDES